MSQRKGWLPREGFTLDVVTTIIKQTLLNPTLTVPLWLLTRHTNSGRGFALDNPVAASRLKTLVYLGAARYLNGLLNKGAQNSWTRAEPDWRKEFVVVTGGSDGIGKLLVKMFAARGVKTVILDIQEPTYELPSETTFFVKADLTDPEALKSACDTVKAQYGDPSVLVLNAGIINRHAIIDTPDHLLRRVFDLNVLAQYRMVKEFLPAMIKVNHGMVCTTASLAGWVTCPGMVDYNSTKAAVVSFHEGLTAELATWYNAPGIRTICICPNFVHTKLAEGFVNESTFTNPTLVAETVAEVEFDRIWRWEGGMVSVPAVQSSFAMTVRVWPHWLQNAMRNQLRKVMRGVADIEKARVKKLQEQQESQATESIVQVEKDGDGSAMFA